MLRSWVSPLRRMKCSRVLTIAVGPPVSNSIFGASAESRQTACLGPIRPAVSVSLLVLQSDVKTNKWRWFMFGVNKAAVSTLRQFVRLLSRSSGLDVGRRREILDTCYPTMFWNRAVSLGAATPRKINLRSATGVSTQRLRFFVTLQKLLKQTFVFLAAKMVQLCSTRIHADPSSSAASEKPSEDNWNVFKGSDTTDLVSFNVCRHANGCKLADKKYTKAYFKGPTFTHSKVFIFHPGPNGAASHDLLSIKLYRSSAYLALCWRPPAKNSPKH